MLSYHPQLGEHEDVSAAQSGHQQTLAEPRLADTNQSSQGFGHGKLTCTGANNGHISSKKMNENCSDWSNLKVSRRINLCKYMFKINSEVTNAYVKALFVICSNTIIASEILAHLAMLTTVMNF